MATSGSDPRFDSATLDDLLARAKTRSAQLRRRRLLLSLAPRRRAVPAGVVPSAGLTPAPPRRFTPTVVALGGAGVVVAVVIALILAQLGPGTGGSGGNLRPGGTPSDQGSSTVDSVLSSVTAVSTLVANEVGVPPTSTVAPPSVRSGQPLLQGPAGEPAAVFIGGLFCPFCAAERWAIVMAFSRFGDFSGLSLTSSSPWDSDPSTATFSFYGSTYTSSSISLDTVENEGNDTDGLGTRTSLQPLTPLEAQLWKTYDNPEGFPFLDIANKFFVLNPSFDPTVLAGLDQQDIAARLSNPQDPVTISIVGTATYLTAAICSALGPAATGGNPWCHQTAVTAAAMAMGLDVTQL